MLEAVRPADLLVSPAQSASVDARSGTHDGPDLLSARPSDHRASPTRASGVAARPLQPEGDGLEIGAPDPLAARRHAAGWRVALVVAVLGHLGFGFAVYSLGRPDAVGAGGTDFEAISVEIELVPLRVARAPASQARLPPPPPPPVAPPAPAATRPPVDPVPPPPEPARAPDPPSEPAPAPMAVLPPPPPKTATRMAQPPPAPPVGPPPVEAAASAPPAPTPAPPSAASPGAVDAYAQSVVRILSRSRPHPPRGAPRGTARIAFLIAADGTPTEVRVAQSSGHAVLDETAAAAIRSARFPAPPASFSLGQRRYEIPYHFR